MQPWSSVHFLVVHNALHPTQKKEAAIAEAGLQHVSATCMLSSATVHCSIEVCVSSRPARNL